MNRNVIEHLKECLKDIIEDETNIRPLTRNENGDVICYQCGRVAKEHCHTEAGLREVEISGLCEECYDKLFEEDEEDWNKVEGIKEWRVSMKKI